MGTLGESLGPLPVVWCGDIDRDHQCGGGQVGWVVGPFLVECLWNEAKNMAIQVTVT